jgi:hypothetical protein
VVQEIHFPFLNYKPNPGGDLHFPFFKYALSSDGNLQLVPSGTFFTTPDLLGSYTNDHAPNERTQGLDSTFAGDSQDLPGQFLEGESSSSSNLGFTRTPSPHPAVAYEIPSLLDLSPKHPTTSSCEQSRDSSCLKSPRSLYSSGDLK